MPPASIHLSLLCPTDRKRLLATMVGVVRHISEGYQDAGATAHLRAYEISLHPDLTELVLSEIPVEVRRELLRSATVLLAGLHDRFLSDLRVYWEDVPATSPARQEMVGWCAATLAVWTLFVDVYHVMGENAAAHVHC